MQKQKGSAKPLLLTLPLLLVACTKSGGTSEPSTPSQQLPPPTLHELLPLKDKTISQFVTHSDLGDEGMLVLEIFRPRPEMAELSIAGRVQRLVVEDHRIVHTIGGTVLEEPLKEGHSFVGSFGTVTITDVDAHVEVPAGTFEQCLVTVEESTRPPKRSTSTYCRNVGLVSLDVESFGDDAVQITTALVQHGPRVDLRSPPPPDQAR